MRLPFTDSPGMDGIMWFFTNKSGEDKIAHSTE